MKTLIKILFPILLFSFAFSQNKTNSVTWNEFEKGVELSKKSNKKLLVDVYTDWCTWCKKMDSDVYANDKIQNYLKNNFVTVKLNAEGTKPVKYMDTTFTPPDFSRGMGVTGYPATLFFTATGEPITLLPGYIEAPMFLNVLKYISENRYKNESFDSFVKSIKTETK